MTVDSRVNDDEYLVFMIVSRTDEGEDEEDMDVNSVKLRSGAHFGAKKQMWRCI